LKKKKRTRSNQSAPATTVKQKRREIFVYDGRDCIGRFVFDEKVGAAKAFNVDGKAIRKFPSFGAAARAVSRSHMAAKEKEAGGASGANALTNSAYTATLPAEASRGAPAG
jgi:hypothetical protein